MVRNIASSLKDTLKGVSLSLLPLSFNLVGILAGSIVAFYHSFITANPWTLVVYPGILSIRGAIGGVYAGRLGTALHLGTIKPTIRGNTEESITLISAITTLTLVSGLILGTMTSLFLYVFLGSTQSEVVLSFLVVIATMATSVLVISPITFLISVYSFRKGLDPDVVVYPIISTVADVIITVFYIAMIKSSIAHTPLIVIIDLIFASIVAIIALKNYRNKEYLKTIKEFMITLLVVSIIVNITGSALEGFTKKIGIMKEIFVVYPAVIDTVGDVGAIVGSTASTKIILGIMPPSIRGARAHTHQILNTWVASLILFIMYSFAASILFGMDKFSRLLLQLITVNVLVVPLIILVSLSIAVFTSRRGWNPDNFTTPIESVLSDALTTLAILLVIYIWR